MRAVIQRVSSASVSVEDGEPRNIGQGLVILLGIAAEDDSTDITWMAGKIAALRVFGDGTGKMNLSVKDVKGEILVVSQFTLAARVNKGNRPSFDTAAPTAAALPLYERFLTAMEGEMGRPPSTGEFGARMRISLVNEGPVTFILNSRNKD